MGQTVLVLGFDGISPFTSIVLHTLFIHIDSAFWRQHTKWASVCASCFTLGNTLAILGTLLKCIGLPCMGHKCLRSGLFKIDENLALCNIPTKKVTLGWDLDVLSKDTWQQLWLNSFLPIIKYSILICLNPIQVIQSFQLLNIQFWST